MGRIWQTYKYIYYWLYTWNRGLWGENDGPHFNASIGMSMSLACLLGSIAVIFELITGIEIIPSNLPKIRVALVGVAFLLSHYLAFVYKGKYKEIEEEFKNESKEERKRKGKWVLLYTFGSMAFYIFLLFFGIWIKR